METWWNPFVCLWREVMTFSSGPGRRPGPVEPAGAPVARLPSYIWSRRWFQSSSTPHSRALLSLPLLHPCGKRPFCTWRFAWVCLHRLQSFAEAGEATSEACERGFTTTCWRMGFLSLTQRDTVRRHFRSLSEHGAPRQSLLSTNWSSPLGFVYLNETLRPWGVCWGKVRNAKYLFLSSSSSFVFPFFFSLVALQLREPKILGKHPGSAALLSRSPSQRPPPHSDWDLWFPAQFQWPATSPYEFIFPAIPPVFILRHKKKSSKIKRISHHIASLFTVELSWFSATDNNSTIFCSPLWSCSHKRKKTGVLAPSFKIYCLCIHVSRSHMGIMWACRKIDSVPAGSSA